MIDFEKNMISNISNTLEFAIEQYAKLQKAGAGAADLEKMALRIQKYEEQIYQLEMAIANR